MSLFYFLDFNNRKKRSFLLKKKNVIRFIWKMECPHPGPKICEYRESEKKPLKSSCWVGQKITSVTLSLLLDGIIRSIEF